MATALNSKTKKPILVPENKLILNLIAILTLGFILSLASACESKNSAKVKTAQNPSDYPQTDSKLINKIPPLFESDQFKVGNWFMWQKSSSGKNSCLRWTIEDIKNEFIYFKSEILSDCKTNPNKFDLITMDKESRQVENHTRWVDGNQISVPNDQSWIGKNLRSYFLKTETILPHLLIVESLQINSNEKFKLIRIPQIKKTYYGGTEETIAHPWSSFLISYEDNSTPPSQYNYFSSEPSLKSIDPSK